MAKKKKKLLIFFFVHFWFLFSKMNSYLEVERVTSVCKCFLVSNYEVYYEFRKFAFEMMKTQAVMGFTSSWRETV